MTDYTCDNGGMSKNKSYIIVILSLMLIFIISLIVYITNHLVFYSFVLCFISVSSAIILDRMILL